MLLIYSYAQETVVVLWMKFAGAAALCDSLTEMMGLRVQTPAATSVFEMRDQSVWNHF